MSAKVCNVVDRSHPLKRSSTHVEWHYICHGAWRRQHLRAVIVSGTVVEGRNHLFIFGLGSVVTHRVNKLQRGGREVFGRDVCVFLCLFG